MHIFAPNLGDCFDIRTVDTASVRLIGNLGTVKGSTYRESLIFGKMCISYGVSIIRKVSVKKISKASQIAR